MSAATIDAARAQACEIVRAGSRGCAAPTLGKRAAEAQRIAAAIFRRWHVGPYAWRLKHVQWFLRHGCAELSGHSRYQLWLVLRCMLGEERRRHWMHGLQGPWLRPTGQGGPLGRGRRPRLR